MFIHKLDKCVSVYVNVYKKSICDVLIQTCM